LPIGSGTTFVFTPSQTAIYQVVGTSLNGCKDSVETTVIVHPNPIANVSATPLFLTSDSPFVTFQNNSLGQSISIWNLGDGTILENNSGSFEHTYPFFEGNYLVNLTVSNEFGCSDFTTISIQIKGDVIFYIPNSFTPDGDEYNNMFTPIFTSGFDPANFKMDIYNRWGELIFETFDARKGWDGYLDFKKCPIGTYSYSIQYKLPETDEYRVVNGHINLIR
jgi:gliding motility-associated-like protein